MSILLHRFAFIRLCNKKLWTFFRFVLFPAAPQTLAAHGFIDGTNSVKSGQVSEGGGEVVATGAPAAMEQDLEARRKSGLVWSFVGGSFAGLCQAAVIIPTDNIKIKLQVLVM